MNTEFLNRVKAQEIIAELKKANIKMAVTIVTKEREHKNELLMAKCKGIEEMLEDSRWTTRLFEITSAYKYLEELEDKYEV